MEKLKVKIEESVEGASLLERISYLILLATAFLLPVFFIPSLSFPFQFSKSVFISVATLVAFTLWLIARLKDGRHPLPNNIVFLGAALVLIATLVATLLSPVVSVSLMGQGYEVGTWANFVVLFVLMILFAALFRPKEKVFYLYLVFFCSFCLLVLFHTLRFIFGKEFLSFGIFTDITSNLIGKWNDLGIFFAFVSLLSMMTIELLSLSKAFKALIWVVFILSVLSLCVVNFVTVWYILAFFSILYFVYAYAFKKHFNDNGGLGEGGVSADIASFESEKPKARRGSWIALALILISLVFLADNYTTKKTIGTKIAQKFGISHLEVRPNWTSTIQVMKSTLKESPWFGVGPNRFTGEWYKNKPDGINQSLFWNTDFNFAVGLLPTFVMTTGIVGGITWLFFLATLLYVGLKALLSPVTDKLGRYLSVSSFFASAFLWAFFIFYIPSTVVLSLTFLFTGVFLASLYNEKLIKPKTISLVEEPRISFVSVLVLTALLVGVVSLGYGFAQYFMGAAYFQKALIASNINGDLPKAESYAKSALSHADIDVYQRFLVEVDLAKINTLLSQTPASADADEVRTQFQNLMAEALLHAKAAAEYDKTDYQNWVELGRIYEAVVPLKIQGAYESAKGAYEQAERLNPTGPHIDLMLARLDMANNSPKDAKAHIDTALTKKSNYTEAIFLLSQIQASEGKLADAIKSAESAAVLAPSDPTVFFQLGLLKYNNRDYRGAIQALERATALAPSYANAKYFLGLSYYEVGQTNDALTQLNDIKTLNPSNQEVPIIMENVRAGRDPFAQIKPADRPDQRDTLPVSETTPEEERR